MDAVKKELASVKREVPIVRETLAEMQAENVSRWTQAHHFMTAMASAFDAFTSIEKK